MIFVYLLTLVCAEVNNIKFQIISNSGRTENANLLLSNVKSQKPEAELEFEESIEFPCKLIMPSSAYTLVLNY